MIDKIRISGIKHDSIVDGEGFRNVVFISGCWWNCPQCHNPTTHNKDNGDLLLIKDVVNDLIEDGNQITISGGDALTYQLNQTKELICQIKVLKPDVNIWLYTGFKFEDILDDDNVLRKEVLSLCDVLVDGQFINELKDLTLQFRGSSNQRIIDVKKSLKENKVIEWKVCNKH